LWPGPGLPCGCGKLTLAGSAVALKVTFYGDSFVKPFLVVHAAMFARVPVRLDQSIWQIRGRGMRKVRASARTSFYPCRTQASDTTCNIRAECAGKPLLPTRPIFADGHFVVTR
jgi:hypothetical protein